MWRWYKGGRKKFWLGRPAQSEEEFIARCHLLSQPRGRELARAVRQVLANLAGVCPESIHADDRVADLLRDVVEFVLGLEELELAYPLSRQDLENWTTTLTGRDLITLLYRRVFP